MAESLWRSSPLVAWEMLCRMITRGGRCRLGRWRWLWVAVVAVLPLVSGVAVNQVLSGEMWQWWPWVPLAVVVAVVGAVATEWLTRSAPDRRVAPDGAEAAQRPAVDAGSPSAIQVGEGDGEMREEFQASYEAAGGAEVLGEPEDQVTSLGPGYVQTFVGRGPASLVVCGLPGRPAAVVPTSLWKALNELGNDQSDEDGVVAAGFPVSISATEPLVLVDSSTTMVELDGGHWGRGRLRRTDPDGSWWWEPVPFVDTYMSGHADRWASMAPVDLQLRAVAELPWRRSAVASEVSPERRRLLQQRMAATELAKVFAVLSMHRGALVTEPGWSTATGVDSFGSDRCVHLRAVLAAPDGRPALTGDVLLHLPDYVGLSSVLGLAQVRINFDAWRLALETAGSDLGDNANLRLSLREVIDVLASTWGTVTGAVPLAAVEDPRQVPIVRPPFVALHLLTNPANQQPNQGLAGAIDLSALRTATNERTRPGTGMRAFAPLDVARAVRRDLIAEGLARLGRSWGYVDAQADDLLAIPGRSQVPVAGQ